MLGQKAPALRQRYGMRIHAVDFVDFAARDGDQIVTGSYKALRTLRPGSTVKVDNSEPKRDEPQDS